MIRVILKGGLGNQMFQYALGKSLSLKHKVPLYLDLSHLYFRIPLKKYGPLKHFTYRDFVLDIFDIKEERGLFLKSCYFTKYFSYPAETLYYKLFKNKFFTDGANPYKYRGEVFDKGSKLTIEGYWNNYQYFSTCENEIRKIFDPDKLYDESFAEFEKEISTKENSVAVHLRRGDYLNPKHKKIYVQLNDYYKKAVRYIKDTLPNPYFYIFAETDAGWLESYLNLASEEYKIVGSNYFGDKNKTHFRLMTLCRHNIISNSTYSWWAAYLNKNKDKIVVAPDKWMRKYEFENPKGWVEIAQ